MRSRSRFPRSTRALGTLAASALVAVMVLGVTATQFVQSHVLANTSGLAFSTPIALSASNGPINALDLATADLGNGAQDILVAEPTQDPPGATLLDYVNDGSGSFTETTPTGITPPVATDAIAVGHFMGTKAPAGVVAVDGADDQLVLYEPNDNGSGTLMYAGTLSLSEGSPTAVATGDFNGDGYADIVATYAGAQSGAVVFLNKGDGTFGSAISLTFGGSDQAGLGDSPAGGVGSIVTGNFNGQTGIAMVDHSNQGADVFLGHGNGTFASSVFYPFGVTLTGGKLTLAHINGKSAFADIIASGTNYSTTEAGEASENETYPDGDESSLATILPLYNGGAGTFTVGSAADLGLTSYATNVGASTADFNGDGLPDLAVGVRSCGASSCTGNLYVFPGVINTSTGHIDFSTTGEFSVGGATDQAEPTSVIASDLLTGNDRLPDIVALTTGANAGTKTVAEVFSDTAIPPTSQGPHVDSHISGGETINGVTYITPSSVITLTASNAEAILYQYYSDELYTANTSSLMASGRVGGTRVGSPTGSTKIYPNAFVTATCTNTTTCTTNLTISGSGSTTTAFIAPQTAGQMSAEARTVAGAKTVTITVSDLMRHNALSNTVLGPYTIAFFAIGTNGSGSPATAQTLQVTLVNSLPKVPTNGRSGSGQTTSPVTAGAPKQPHSPQQPQQSAGSTTGSTANTANQQHDQQTAGQQPTNAASAGQTPLTLVLAIALALVIFGIGGGLAVAYSRRRQR